MNASSPIRLYIFDADGTLRRCTVPGRPCPHADDEWELIPGVRERLAEIDWSTADYAIASNQGGIPLGYLSPEMAFRLLLDMASAAWGKPPEYGRVMLCPHAKDAGCGCRKPAPGMLTAILRAADVPPEAAIYVGDRDEDRLAAERAGIRFAWADVFFRRSTPVDEVPVDFGTAPPPRPGVVTVIG